MQSSNPALRQDVFTSVAHTSSETMSIQGTVNKSLFLLLLVFATSAAVWNSSVVVAGGFALIGGIGALILAVVTVFKKEWAKFTAPVYAVLQGALLGGISSMIEMKYPGIVMQAVGLTFSTTFCMLGAYKTGLIRATDKFKRGMAIAMGGLFLFYIVMMVLGLFGIQPAFFHGSSNFSIIISLVIVGIAALNLIMDFDFIESGSRVGAPKYMEWYGAFALLVTLIWLYMEILRLLMKLQDRRNN